MGMNEPPYPQLPPDPDTPLPVAPVAPQQPEPPRKRISTALGATSILLVLLLLAGGYVLLRYKIFTNPDKKSNSALVLADITTSKDTTGTAATLGVGSFTVGKDTKPGLYSIVPGTEQSGNFTLTSHGSTYTVILDDIKADTYGVPLAWVYLENGDTVQIDGSRLQHVTFTPVHTHAGDTPPLARLYDNTFHVSTTAAGALHPGSYTGSAEAGKNGYVLVLSQDYKVKYNQPLTPNGTPLDLVEGDLIAISGVNTIHFQPKQ